MCEACKGPARIGATVVDLWSDISAWAAMSDRLQAALMAMPAEAAERAAAAYKALPDAGGVARQVWDQPLRRLTVIVRPSAEFSRLVASAEARARGEVA